MPGSGQIRSRHDERIRVGTHPHSRDVIRPSFALPPFAEDAGNAGCAVRTRSLVRKSRKRTRVVTTGRTVQPAFPARWCYGFLRARPGDRALLSPSLRDAKHHRELISASGHQAHTTSPSASSPLVSRCQSVHRIPRPTFVTIAKRPLLWGTGRAKKCL